MSLVRRARTDDLDDLLVLVREFYEVDRHEYDEPRVRKALEPLLTGDEHGQVWLLNDGSRTAAGYAVVTWGWSLAAGRRYWTRSTSAPAAEVWAARFSPRR